MIWRFEKKKRHVFARNPLDTVVVQLRFQPILRINEGKGVADFQEGVRASFPGYSEKEVRNFTINPLTKVTTKIEKVFQFTRAGDHCKVQLSPDNVLVETKMHRDRDELIRDMRTVITALENVYNPLETQRLGIRYVNVIRKEVVAKDLARNTSWERLVSAEYLRMPAKIADLEKTSFANQISSPMPIGDMTLRYGLVRQDIHQDATFNFDIDRYIDGVVDLDDLENIMIQFTDDIFSLFNTLPGTDLTEWMSAGGLARRPEGIH